MVNSSSMALSKKVIKIMLKYKAKKAKQKIANLFSHKKNAKIGIVDANRVYSAFIWQIEKYDIKKYKHNCTEYVQKCVDKINA